MKEINVSISSRHLNTVRNAVVFSLRQAKILASLLLSKGYRVTITVKEAGKTFIREVQADYYSGVSGATRYAPTRGEETTREVKIKKGVMGNWIEWASDKFKIA